MRSDLTSASPTNSDGAVSPGSGLPPIASRNEIRLTGAYQDGDNFYVDVPLGDDDIGQSPIARYPGTVKHDYDMDGAYEARLCFVRDHPEYGFVVVPECRPASQPFFDEALLSSYSLHSLGRCEMHGCPDEAVGFNDQHEALCEDHLHEWALGEDDGFGEFDE